MFQRILLFAQSIGPMRVTLGLFALALVILNPAPGATHTDDGFGVFRTMIVPALSPLVFMVLMLDVLMSRVHMIDADQVTKSRYRRIIFFNLGLAGLLLLSWLPYFLSVTV